MADTEKLAGKIAGKMAADSALLRHAPEPPKGYIPAPSKAEQAQLLDEVTARLAATGYGSASRVPNLSDRAVSTGGPVGKPRIASPVLLNRTQSAREPGNALVLRTETLSDSETQNLRLPSAWYEKPHPVAKAGPGLSSERHGLIIRAAAAACLIVASGLLVWLSTMESTPSRQTARATVASPSSVPPSLTSTFAPQHDVSETASKAAREQIPTAQILAVAERFVATGDVLAARAMLQDRAGAGEPRALFALAETYDPHMLASWGARDADPSATYARFLYEAARRGGLVEAQTRLDALK